MGPCPPTPTPPTPTGTDRDAPRYGTHGHGRPHRARRLTGGHAPPAPDRGPAAVERLAPRLGVVARRPARGTTHSAAPRPRMAVQPGLWLRRSKAPIRFADPLATCQSAPRLGAYPSGIRGPRLSHESRLAERQSVLEVISVMASRFRGTHGYLVDEHVFAGRSNRFMQQPPRRDCGWFRRSGPPRGAHYSRQGAYQPDAREKEHFCFHYLAEWHQIRRSGRVDSTLGYSSVHA